MKSLENKEKPKSKKKLITVSIIILAVLIFIIFEDNGIYKRISLKNSKNHLIEKISSEQKIQDSLKLQIDQLTNDSLEIERVARIYYGMVKPGEKIYYIKQKN